MATRTENSKEDSLSRHTVWGIKWASLAFVVDKLATLGMMALLARLLSPLDFALFASAALIVSLVEALRDIGFRDALIWSSRVVGALSDTLFWFNVGIGFALAVLLFVFAPFISEAMDTPGMIGLIQILAFSLLITALGTTHEALQDKALYFGWRYGVDLGATIAKVCVTVLLAYAGFGATAIALGILAASLVRSAGRWLTFRWMPRLRLSGAKLAELFRYGRHILIIKAADALVERADQIVIVILLTTVPLGYYYVAARIPELLIGSVTMVATRVLFPSYVSINSDPVALRAFFLAATRITAYLAIPAGIGLALVSDLTVDVLFGQQWAQSARPLAVLALCGIITSLMWSAGDVMKAVGHPEYLARITLAHLMVIVPIIFLLVGWFGTIEAAAWGLFISLVVDGTIKYFIAQKLIEFEGNAFARTLIGSVLASLLMAGAAALVRLLMMDMPSTLSLATTISVGGLVYVLALWSIERDKLISVLKAVAR